MFIMCNNEKVFIITHYLHVHINVLLYYVLLYYCINYYVQYDELMINSYYVHNEY